MMRLLLLILLSSCSAQRFLEGTEAPALDINATNASSIMPSQSPTDTRETPAPTLASTYTLEPFDSESKAKPSFSFHYWPSIMLFPIGAASLVALAMGQRESIVCCTDEARREDDCDVADNYSLDEGDDNATVIEMMEVTSLAGPECEVAKESNSYVRMEEP